MAHFIPDITALAHSIAQRLAPAYENDLQLTLEYAWWMLEAITEQSKATLLAAKKLELSNHGSAKLEHWITQQVSAHEPLQYLLGKVPFCGVEIMVEPPVLIPRPETEEWVSRFLELLQPFRNEPFYILDMCAGSGCIALAFAKALPHATVYAVDISPAAVQLIQKNASHNNIRNVKIVQSDLFAQIPPHIKFDLVVSNPPYITEAEWLTLAPSVKNWEDKGALVAPNQGLLLIEFLIRHAPAFVKANPFLKKALIPNFGVEIGYKQGNPVKALFIQAGLQNVQIWQDLAHKDRFVGGEINP